MADATAIVNALPLISVSTDPEEPRLLCRTAWITQKTGERTEDYKDLVSDKSTRSNGNMFRALQKRFVESTAT